MAAHVRVDDGLALGAHLEGHDLEVREHQPRLNADAARAEADVPEHVATRQVEGLQREQADGHLGNHLLAAVEQGELPVGNAVATGRKGLLGGEHQAVGETKVALGRFFEAEGGDALVLRMP